MQKQKFHPSTPPLIALTIASISLFAAGCSNKPQTVERPKVSVETSTSSPEQNPLTNTETNSTDTGEVAGTEVVALPKKLIRVRDLELNVEVADNDISRTQGLSNRDKLDEGTGLLFDFTNTNYRKPGFWMKDMLMSIDIIWVQNNKIVGVQERVPLPPQDSDLPVYYPPTEITHVLEVSAGWFEKNKLKVGDIIQF